MEPTLFQLGSDREVDLSKTGGLELSVDSGFEAVERIHLDETSWVDHVHGWLSNNEVLMEALMTTAQWEQRSRWMYTRRVQEPRMTAEYPVISESPLPVLRYIAEELGTHYRQAYTRLWMNWYRDNNDGTGWHADRPANRLDTVIIPVLSLGATRRFLIRPESGGASTVITTHGGDLVVMGGRSQRDYRHSVPKQKQTAGPRLSLNFSANIADSDVADDKASADQPG